MRSLSLCDLHPRDPTNGALLFLACPCVESPLPRTHKLAHRLPPCLHGHAGARRGGAFMPFSAGPRDCVGQSLALLELRTALATLLGRARWARDLCGLLEALHGNGYIGGCVEWRGLGRHRHAGQFCRLRQLGLAHLGLAHVTTCLCLLCRFVLAPEMGGYAGVEAAARQQITLKPMVPAPSGEGPNAKPLGPGLLMHVLPRTP